MTDELPQALLDLIGARLPAFQAAELLVFIAANPDREFTAEDVVVSMRQAIITVPGVKEYVASFVGGGLLAESNGRFRYARPREPSRPACASWWLPTTNGP